MDKIFALVTLTGGIAVGMHPLPLYVHSLAGTLLGRYVVVEPKVRQYFERHRTLLRFLTAFPALLTVASVYFQRRDLQWHMCLFTSSCCCWTAFVRSVELHIVDL